ncbi:MAG: hypothetical protein J6Q94_02155 [Clostridia bacterium]|nr:hypothetical protein [Clostridia bacterium]
MKKIFKCFVAMLLVVLLVFSATSCNNQADELLVDFENPFADMTYSEIMAQAEEINADRVYSTENNNTFEITSVKAKKLIVSGKSVVLSAITFAVAFIFGGVYTTPGIIYASKGEKTLEVKIKYTNNSSESVMIGDVLHTAFAVESGNIYNGVCGFDKFIKIDFSCTEEIEPGKTKTFKLLFTSIPEDLIKNHSTFDVNFDVEGEIYSLNFAG